MSNPSVLETPGQWTGVFDALKAAASQVEGRYRASRPRSEALFAEACQVFPGGYTRDAVMRAPFAPFLERGEGAVLHDKDGREIVDFWFNATSLPLGHAHPAVVEAVVRQTRLGSAFFGLTEAEIALARMLIERLPSAERVRFANSGSEAVMMALRLARAATKRDLIVKFEGSYHGSYDDVQWSVAPPLDRAGEAEAPVAVPDTSGLPEAGGRVMVLPYNNAQILTATLETLGDRVAGVLIEPMANRIGLILPEPAFLAAARAACDAAGALLIFDEVIAFRIGYHGAQGELGVTPDLTTLGKIIGGGYPVGAIAGRADILMVSAPGAASRMTHAGTFNANPVTMAAGKATLDNLTPQAFEQLNGRGAHIREELSRLFAGLPVTISGAGSLFKINATPREIVDYRTAASADKEWERLASLHLLNEGYLLTNSLQGCVSLVTTEAQIAGLLGAVEDLITRYC
jgi:glutamate-1-semialdehyde 2,1-aminomutase